MFTRDMVGEGNGGFAMAKAKGIPIEGWSHWCDGDTKFMSSLSGRPRECNNVVRNDSERCAAGHPNRIRLEPHLSTVERPTVDSVVEQLASLTRKPEGTAAPSGETSYEIQDLAAPPATPLSATSGNQLKLNELDELRAWVGPRPKLAGAETVAVANCRRLLDTVDVLADRLNRLRDTCVVDEYQGRADEIWPHWLKRVESDTS